MSLKADKMFLERCCATYRGREASRKRKKTQLMLVINSQLEEEI
jgi:hypothetical protein